MTSDRVDAKAQRAAAMRTEAPSPKATAARALVFKPKLTDMALPQAPEVRVPRPTRPGTSRNPASQVQAAAAPRPARFGDDAPENMDSAADSSVGQKLRQLRKARGLSLRQLSDEADISISFVSQIERGLSSPSVRTLVRLADVLGVSMGELFSGLGHKLDGEARIVARTFEQRTLGMPSTHVVKRWLTPFSKVPRLDIYTIELAVDGTSGDHSYAHEGEEAGLVLEGGLELIVDRQRYVLGEGDSFRFASSRPHRFANAGNRRCKVLWINYRETGSSAVTRFTDEKEPEE